MAGEQPRSRPRHWPPLAQHHHRLVHEGGYDVSLSAAGVTRFTQADGAVITAGRETRFCRNVLSLQAVHQHEQLEIDPRTLPPYWTGECMDMEKAVDGLLRRDGG